MLLITMFGIAEIAHRVKFLSFCDLSFAVHVSYPLRPMSHKFIFTSSVQYRHADCGAFIELFLNRIAHESDTIYQS
jgi:hypothetical protein